MNNIDVKEVMVTTFLGYKYRKQNDLLYSVNAKIPRSLINMYYSGEVDRIDPTIINRRFVERYIKNESATENVREPEELLGLEVMYEDMISMPLDELELFSIGVLNRDLYSKCPFPKKQGEQWRNTDAHVEGKPTDLIPHTEIFTELEMREPIVKDLKGMAKYMKETQDYSRIFDYIGLCVRLNADLLKIHPFADGNGRTIRCFTNKLFIEAGLPPVYVKASEKQDYMRGLDLAQNQNDYRELVGFYLYKICDSIIELDINNRVKQERAVETYDVKKKSKKKNKR
jgi:hypothetical protein